MPSSVSFFRADKPARLQQVTRRRRRAPHSTSWRWAGALSH